MIVSNNIIRIVSNNIIMIFISITVEEGAYTALEAQSPLNHLRKQMQGVDRSEDILVLKCKRIGASTFQVGQVLGRCPLPIDS